MARNLDGGEPIAFEDLRQVIKKKEPAITDLHSKPITPLRYTDKQEKTLKQVAHDTSVYHAREHAAELLGPDADKWDDASKQYLGEELRKDTPTKVGLRLPDGTPVAPLDDMSPVMLQDSGNLREITKMQGLERQAEFQKAQYEEDRRAFETQQAQEQERLRQEETARLDQENRVAVERARTEATRRHSEAQQQFNQLSQVEQAAHHERAQIKQFWDTYYPPQIRTPEGWAQLQRVNPQYAQYLQEHIPNAVARDRELSDGLKQASDQRELQLRRALDAQQADFTKADKDFEEATAQSHPQYARGTPGRAQLTPFINAYLKEDLRLSDQQIAGLRNDPSYRTYAAQVAIRDGAIRKLEAARANAVLAAKRAKPLPTVAPYAARPRGAGDMDAVMRAGRALEEARSPQAALRASVQDLQARRAAGLIPTF
jgi:hypothetical protein